MEMAENTVLFLKSVKLLLSYFAVVASASHGYKMSDLLKNQLDLQISLSTPAYYAETLAQNPLTALGEAVEFLFHKQVPFRLFFNRTKPKPAPVITHALRYVNTRRSWVVIVFPR